MMLDTLMAVLYGQMGVGKSTELVAAFPLACHFCRPGGLLSAHTYLGLHVARGLDPIQRNLPNGEVWTGFVFESNVASLEDVIANIPLAVEMGFSAIGVDDVSLDAEQTEYDVEQVLSNSEGDLKGGNIFKKFRVIKDRVLEIRRVCRYAGIPVGMTAHEREPAPDFKTGVLIKGGPKFPTKKLTESIAYDADLVLRMIKVGGMWRSVFDSQDTNYVTKDRLSVSPPVAPANLRALLFTAGAVLPRYPGLEWQDEAMVYVRDRMLKGDEREAVVAETFTKLRTAEKHPQHIAWAVRDGLAAHQYQQFVLARWENDFIVPEASVPGLGGDLTAGGGQGITSIT